MPNDMPQPISAALTERFREKFKREAREFAKAIRSYGLFAAIGFLVGLGFIHLEEINHFKNLAGWRHYMGLILEHGGLGLIVSSIAVFGYEWRSHAKHAFELSEKLQAAIDRVSDMESAKAFEALDRALDTLLGSDDERVRNSLRKNIKEVVESAHELRKRQTPDTLQYLSVISWLIDNTVTKNAKNLLGMAKGTDEEFHYEVPSSAAEMAGRVLAAQMKMMNKPTGTSGDYYDSIANVNHWKGGEFNYYFEKTQRAAKRGVKIRRIFNFNLYETDMERLKQSKLDGETISEEYDDIYTVIKRHVDFAKESDGNYQVRFFLNSHIDKVKKDMRHRSKGDIEGACFGLFKRNSANTIIRFVADTPTLSKMRLGYITANHRDIELFEAIWKVADKQNPLVDPSGEEDMDKKPPSSTLLKRIQKWLQR